MIDDHHAQQQHESPIAAMSQPGLSIGLALAAQKEPSSDQHVQSECKFDDVMALQEETIEVPLPQMPLCCYVAGPVDATLMHVHCHLLGEVSAPRRFDDHTRGWLVYPRP